tara:strand:- start:8675 stop:9343 length:669 start_codon:yes stop_codon:yes gene_type:complete
MASEIKVSSVKAKDGTAGISIADSTGRVSFTETNPSLTLGTNTIFPAGHTLQVLQTIKTDKEQISGSASQNSFTLIPGQGGSGVLQVEITTTGSNKVLVFLSLNLTHNQDGYTFQGAIFRGTAVDTAVGSCTPLGVGTDLSGVGSQNSASFIADKRGNNAQYNMNTMFLDSPGAGTHFYKAGAQFEHHGSSNYGYIGRSNSDGNNAYNASTMSHITVMEIKA